MVTYLNVMQESDVFLASAKIPIWIAIIGNKALPFG